MRDRGDIETRIRDLLCAELDRRVEQATKRLPQRCMYNQRHPLDTRKDVDEAHYNRITDGRGLPVIQTMGLCMFGAENPETWPGNICDDAETARQCPMFEATVSKAELWVEFQEQIANLEWIRLHLPEVFALVWVLDGTVAPVIPWWRRLWFRLRRIDVEAVAPAVDPVNMLPPAPPS